jgi:hypothetical protein
MPMSQQGKMIGSYNIEAVKQTPSGGVYFQTYNFWASAVTSRYGFAYKPTLQKQRDSAKPSPPFGAHTYVHLFGDWYMFHGTTC